MFPLKFAADIVNELALQVFTRSSSLVTPNTFYTLLINPSSFTQNLRILISTKPLWEALVLLMF